MKKLFGLLTVLFILYFSLQILFVYIGNGHIVNYEINDEAYVFTIREEFRANNKKDDNNYSLSITVEDTPFNLLVYEDFKRSSEIVKEIKYYKDDNYKCIFLKYRNNLILNDILCNNGSYTIPYHNIDNPSVSLENFANGLNTYGYEKANWIDNKTEVFERLSLRLYPQNIKNKHFAAMVYNNHLYRINNLDIVAAVDLPKATGMTINAFVGDKYVLNDYADANNSTYTAYSITSSRKNIIKSDKVIKNPKILGTYANSIFLFDQTNKIEYELDTETNKILEIANAETNIKYYSNGKWNYEKLENLDLNNLNFGSEYENDYNNANFDKTIKIGHKYGYYYYFKRYNNGYQVYRSTLKSTDNLTYLFFTTSIDSVKFIDSYIYYVDNQQMKYYHDKDGNRTLFYLANMPDNILYNVFIDK